MAVELPKYKKNTRDAWDDEQARYAFQVCDDPILKLCMLLALGCSMRIGQILGLTWDCVHIEPNLIQSDEAYVYVEKETVPSPMDESMEQLIHLLKNSPETVQPLLQMSQVLGSKK